MTCFVGAKHLCDHEAATFEGLLEAAAGGALQDAKCDANLIEKASLGNASHITNAFLLTRKSQHLKTHKQNSAVSVQKISCVDL